MCTQAIMFLLIILRFGISKKKPGTSLVMLARKSQTLTSQDSLFSIHALKRPVSVVPALLY